LNHERFEACRAKVDLEAWRRRVKEWHEVSREPGLTALVIIEAALLMDDLLPNAFSGLPPVGKEFGSGAALLYFSFSTLTTLGFGDILPVHPLARNIANLEAIIGHLYPATLLARLVSLEIAHRGESRGD